MENYEDHYEHDDDDPDLDAADAFVEDCYEKDDEVLVAMLCDADYNTRWPKAAPLIQAVLADRGWQR
jgi:hypothetical protein